MAKIILEVPDGNTCETCEYRRRNSQAISESYHCAIFNSRVDSQKSAKCTSAEGKNA